MRKLRTYLIWGSQRWVRRIPTVVNCLAYFLTLKIEALCSSEKPGDGVWNLKIISSSQEQISSGDAFCRSIQKLSDIDYRSSFSYTDLHVYVHAICECGPRLRPSAHMQFLVERLLAHSCPRRREPLRLMGVRTHDDSCSNSRRAVVFYLNCPPTLLLLTTPACMSCYGSAYTYNCKSCTIWSSVNKVCIFLPVFALALVATCGIKASRSL
jgi:hypothetical protein